MKRLSLCIILVAILLSGCMDGETVAEKCAKDCQKKDMAFYSVTRVSDAEHKCWCIRDGDKKQIW